MLSQSIATHVRSITRQKGIVARFFDWIVSINQRHKDACRLRDAEAHILRDMGMTREDADQVFYQRWDRH